MQRRGLLLVMLCLAACDSERSTEGPAETVEMFVDRIQRVHGDPQRAQEAYELLSEEVKTNLTERAKRATAVTGRRVKPQEMIAPSRAYLEFKPKSYSARIDGDQAVVTVIGASAGQRRQVQCVKQNGKWRVVMKLPPLPPVQKRTDGGA